MIRGEEAARIYARYAPNGLEHVFDGHLLKAHVDVARGGRQPDRNGEVHSRRVPDGRGQLSMATAVGAGTPPSVL